MFGTLDYHRGWADAQCQYGGRATADMLAAQQDRATIQSLEAHIQAVVDHANRLLRQSYDNYDALRAQYDALAAENQQLRAALAHDKARIKALAAHANNQAGEMYQLKRTVRGLESELACLTRSAVRTG